MELDKWSYETEIDIWRQEKEEEKILKESQDG